MVRGEAFLRRSAQLAVIRSETACVSLAGIARRFLVGVASDAVSATGVAAAAGRREEERRAASFRRSGGPELEPARRTWPLALRALTAENRSLNPADLLCCVT